MGFANLVYARYMRGVITRRLRLFLTEPVVQFLILGSLLYAVVSMYEDRTAPDRIVIDNASIDRLERQFALQFNRQPSVIELDQMAESHVTDEVLYREGLALGLAEDDEIVRRRVIQKMQFLLEAETNISTPDEKQLRAFYDRNRARYRMPERISFSHVYFSPDNVGDAVARQRSLNALARLRAGGNTAGVAGDIFPGQSNYALVSGKQIAREFGRTGLAEALPAVPLGQWHGPLRSGFGWHLIHIDGREDGYTQPFEQVVDRVRTDWIEDESARHRERALRMLLAKYDVFRTADQ